MGCVCTSKGLSENDSNGLRADLSQMTGNEAQLKQNVFSLSTLSKNCQALTANTNKINLVTKGYGHS